MAFLTDTVGTNGAAIHSEITGILEYYLKINPISAVGYYEQLRRYQ